ncbi:hypothetical protein U9M48_004648 [Paspalum notatum var. saurae]|uniref:Uncharacterized protein n=1 Tax=Paspalum notatum var. saurae TaxID=547442 RepID=A0AAQ3SJ86_PASNO
MAPLGLFNDMVESNKASLETLCDVASLTELRAFSVNDVRSVHSESLCRAIMNMSHLYQKNTKYCHWKHSVCQELFLNLYCGWLEKKRMPEILSSGLHLNNLTKLSLLFSKLYEDSFSSLMVLGGLCYLELVRAYDGKKLFFSALSFPQLRRLGIWSAPHLN